MSHPIHHLFLTCSRKDNQPKVGGGEGRITAFYRRLRAQYLTYTERELKVFFDTEEIDHGGDWKGRLVQGLRTSRLFLAFLSPNYMHSPHCRWEWEALGNWRRHNDLCSAVLLIVGNADGAEQPTCNEFFEPISYTQYKMTIGTAQC